MHNFSLGVFMSGNSNMYGSEYFMDEKVVLVTINYRLGSFGKCNIIKQSQTLW